MPNGSSITTEIRWVLGGMATIASVMVALILGFQATVDADQDRRIEQLQLSQESVAGSLADVAKSLERTSEKLDTIDRRGSTYIQQRERREWERERERADAARDRRNNNHQPERR